MSEYREGDTVLLRAKLTKYRPPEGPFEVKVIHGSVPRIGLEWPGTDNMQPDPGVPVEDLLEELEMLWKLRKVSAADPRDANELIRTAYRLREARESSPEPKFCPGDLVWVRAEIAPGGCDPHGNALVKLSDSALCPLVSLRDIRPASEEA